MFVHLHTHSDAGSLQDGAQTVKQIVSRTVELDMPSVAITDHGRAAGLLQLQKECKKVGIKPIFGIELYVAPTSRLVKDRIETESKTAYHLTVLAKNEEGLRNIFRLSSTAWIDGFYYRPRVDNELLFKYNEGLVVLSGCGSGRLSIYLLEERWKEVATHVEEYKKVFKDNFYIEVQNHGIDWQLPLKSMLFTVSDKYNIPIVTTQDSHYINREDAKFHGYLCKLAAGDLSFDCDQSWFKSEDEIKRMFEPNEWHAIERTKEVADKCNCDWQFGKTIWPVYDLPQGVTAEQQLRDDAWAGFKRLFGEGTEEYRNRLLFELDMIVQMGFPTYFLIVADLINWAKKNNIPTGPGRGSCCGSLACYCVGITEVDPIKYSLYFERFVNPSRGNSLPDIDLDICKRDRYKVVQYLIEKYGSDKLAQIGTYAVFKPRGALKAFARVCGHESSVGHQLASMVPPDVAGKQITFEELKDYVPALFKTEYQDVVDLAVRAEGIKNQAGIHAAGVIIADRSISDLVPLFRGKHDEIATQFDMHDTEELGLIKIDLLGLKTLTVIKDTLDLIKQNKGIDINLLELEDGDKATYNTFKTGNLTGIFQFETSGGFKDLCMQVKPDNINDLSSVTSIFRPGPLCISGDSMICRGGWTHRSGKLRFDREKLSTFYERVKELKESTNRKGRYFSVYSKDLSTGKLIKSKVLDVVYAGIKKVYKIKTKTNTSSNDDREKSITGVIRQDVNLKATLEHRFLTLEGWKQLKELKQGDYICILRKAIGNKKPRKDLKTIEGRKNFRNIAFYHYKYQCVFCDWDKGSLDVNHIQGNRLTNNVPENLVFLCPNHHREYTENSLTTEQTILRREKYRLPLEKDFRWVLFKGIEEAGEEPVYDIVLEDSNHNFIANDFVVHNSCGLAQKYIDGRNGKSVEYLIPELEPILKDMYGCMIFQESVMKICTDIAGYSLSDADNMRKVIGKKLSDKMKLERDKFVNGCIKNGISETKASLLFDDIDGYSSYSFNKSHGVSYSVISYRTAWLKTHYPLEFYTALLNNSDTQDDIVKYIYAAKQEGINISPPDVNYSKQCFSLHNDSIVYGLSGIKGIGEKACDKIIEQKPANGYREIEDLIECGVQKDNIVALTKAGALDSFDLNRLQIVNSIDAQCEYYRKHTAWKERRDRYLAREEEIADAVSKGVKPPRRLPKLPSGPEKPEVLNIEYVPKDVYTSMEWEALNIYLTSHPLDSISAKGAHTIDMVKSGLLEDGSIFNILAIVTSVSEKRSRSGKNYAICILEDRTNRCECTIFAKSWDRIKGNIEVPMVCFVKGRANKDSDDNDSQVVKLSILEVDKVQTIELPGKIDLKLKDGTLFSFTRTESTKLENWKSAITYADGLKEMQ